MKYINAITGGCSWRECVGVVLFMLGMLVAGAESEEICVNAQLIAGACGISLCGAGVVVFRSGNSTDSDRGRDESRPYGEWNNNGRDESRPYGR